MKSEILKLVANGFYKDAIFIYAKYHSASIRPHLFIFPSLLKACAKLRSFTQLQTVHAQVVKLGFHSSVYAATGLVDAYMKLRHVDSALQVFDETPERNLAVMNAVVSGFSQCGFGMEAFEVFRDILSGGMLRPNSVCVASVVVGCQSVEVGRVLHCLAVKLGVADDAYVASSLVTMYLNCSDVASGTKFFAGVLDKNVVTYNAFMSGLLQNEVESAVLNVFKDMMGSAVEEPTVVTLASVLSACAALRALSFGKQVHVMMVKTRLVADTMAGTALVDMYSKCGVWQCAYEFFKEMKESRNLFTWNSMISGLILNEQSDEAIQLFQGMRSAGPKPDAATWNSLISGFSQIGKSSEAFHYFKLMQSAGFELSLRCLTSVLKVCSDIFAIRQGKEIHGYLVRTCWNKGDELVVTALIDMYMKCGCSSMAQKVFDQLGECPEDPAVWNAMIFGYGKNGEDELALEIFNQMLETKTQPTLTTFTGVLSACGHTGRVDKGRQVFSMIRDEYGLNPTVENYGAMIDLLGRSGFLEEAYKLVDEMPQPPPASVFASLLGACRSHLNSELGEEIAHKLREIDPENSSPFVILSNIYAAQGRWKDAERIRESMDDMRVRKLPGYSLIEAA
uniref:Pentatricopeptide repeat-containing protein n=1 Tax=Kalanchoe fedtschenkoi TaxID=63787 RepID=A0A7N0UJU5_KALFE